MSQSPKTRLMTIKERLELDALIDKEIAECRALGMTNADFASRSEITFYWKQNNPGVEEIFFNRGRGEYCYQGMYKPQQSLFKRVIQFDLPDNEQFKKAA